jgi:ABC-2 type transport system permease protein
MSPWRVEWLRLVRSRRLIALLGVFVLLGFAEPVATYYLPKLLRHANTASRIRVIAPPPVPADAISGYASNALLIGLIVMVFVAASACMIDGRPALSAFYRTRQASYWRLLLPRVVTVAGAGVGAYVLGLACAWYETRILLGEPGATAMVESAALVALYLVFAATVTAAATTFARTTVAAAAMSLAVLLLIGVASAVPQLKNWLPSQLTDSPDALVRHTEVLSHYLQASIVCAVAVAALMLAALWRGERREVS